MVHRKKHSVVVRWGRAGAARGLFGLAAALVALPPAGCADASRYGQGDGAPGSGATGDAAPAPGPDGAAGACQPDGDGQVTRAELVLGPGRTATVRVATDTDVDTAGQDQDGQRRWDLGGALSGDHDVDIHTDALSDQWFAADFPDGQYTAPLSFAQDLLGVFRVDDDAVRLLGVVSPDDGVTRTELTYDPPVVVMPLPLADGDTWHTDSIVSGLTSGVATYQRDIYDSSVDAGGRLVTPYGEFPVLRVAVSLEHWVGAVLVTGRTFAFVAECYGTVAQIQSDPDETQDEFDHAAELWRLSP